MPSKKKKIHTVFHDSSIKEPELTGENIIHVTTEFASARAGGLGVVVNDITKMQVLAGNNVSVIVPFFQTDELNPAYDFLSTAEQQPINRISIEYKGNTIEADIYSFKYPIDDTHFINVQAIRPIGDYSYLTTIASESNPYMLSQDAIKQAANIWATQSDIVMEKKDEILSNIQKLAEVRGNIQKCYNKAMQLMQEEAEYSHKSHIREKVLSSLPDAEQKARFMARIEENKNIRLEMLSRIKKERDSLELEFSSLLNNTIMPNYTLDGILLKIANEKIHILSMLNAKFLKHNINHSDSYHSPVDFVHLHHFGEEAKSLSEFFEENSDIPRAAIIKSLHSLNVKITHLDGRSHPINEGIFHADAIHLVSIGSLLELQESADPSKDFKVYEENAIDFDKVAVAQNGIDFDKFSLESLWREVCETYSSSFSELAEINFNVLDITEKGVVA